MAKDKKQTGDQGEDIAEKFLIEKGYEIILRNYRYGHGEIDIIAKDKDVLVFVEVKSRHNLDFGYPEEQITPSKQKQIRKIADAYLWENEIENQNCRIDVIGILFHGKKDPDINHIIDAF